MLDIDVKAIPIKIGEPKRIVSLLAGGAFLIAGNMVKQNFLSWMMYGAGLTMLGMTVAGILNPVTIYNAGRMTGQNVEGGRKIFEEYGGTAQFPVTASSAGVRQPAETQVAGIWVPAQGQTLGYYASATINDGNVTGQASGVSNQGIGTYYGAELGPSVPKPPELYSATVGGPAWARDVYSGINIRSYGATQFLGG